MAMDHINAWILLFTLIVTSSTPICEQIGPNLFWKQPQKHDSHHSGDYGARVAHVTRHGDSHCKTSHRVKDDATDEFDGPEATSVNAPALSCNSSYNTCKCQIFEKNKTVYVHVSTCMQGLRPYKQAGNLLGMDAMLGCTRAWKPTFDSMMASHPAIRTPLPG